MERQRLEDGEIVGGVDTHKQAHVAAAVDRVGRLLGTSEFPATSVGYRDLLRWLHGHGEVSLIGVEGTGPYGAGLARYLAREGVPVVEVIRPRCGRVRRLVGSLAFDRVGRGLASCRGGLPLNPAASVWRSLRRSNLHPSVSNGAAPGASSAPIPSPRRSPRSGSRLCFLPASNDAPHASRGSARPVREFLLRHARLQRLVARPPGRPPGAGGEPSLPPSDLTLQDTTRPLRRGRASSTGSRPVRVCLALPQDPSKVSSATKSASRRARL